MNIFVLSNDPVNSAKAHCDKHITKMILETAQLLCTCLRVNNIEYGYKSTHQNHPACIWARSSVANFEWLKQLGLALGDEFVLRYGHAHKSAAVIRNTPNLPVCSLVLTPFIQAMPDEYKNDDVVKAYRAYYRGDKFKKNLLRYTNREPPEWLNMKFEVKISGQNIVYTALNYSEHNEYDWST